LNLSIDQLIFQVNELKAENSLVRSDINILKGRFTGLESNTKISSTDCNMDFVLQLMLDAYEREKCSYYAVISESFSILSTIRVAYDVELLNDTVQHLSLSLPPEIKF